MSPRESRGRRPESGGEDDRPSHPRLAATLLMVAVVVMIFVISAWSAFGY